MNIERLTAEIMGIVGRSTSQMMASLCASGVDQRLHNEAETAARKLRQTTRRAAANLAGLRAALAEAEAAEAEVQTANACLAAAAFARAASFSRA